MQAKLKCAIYTRVSTDMQAEKEFNSCEAQEERIKSFIKSQENMEVYKIYSDPGFSGASLVRPSIQQLLQDISSGNIHCILTYKIDRLTRSPKDFYALIELFEKYHVEYISVTERFDTSSPSGRLLRNIMLTFAQFEREMIAERVKDKMHERAKKGMWNGGKVPFGYDVTNGKLIINRKEASQVRFLFDTFTQTRSLFATYRSLRDNKVFNRLGKEFAISNIEGMTRNVIYIGKIKYSGNIYPGAHEPIISQDQFAIAQGVFRDRKKRIFTSRDYLFSGIIRCEECGSSMTPSFVTKNILKRFYYYRCVSTLKHNWDSCSIKYINAVKLENYILDKLSEISRDANYIENLVFRLNHKSASGGRTGFELSEEKSLFDPKAVKEMLSDFSEGLKKVQETERVSWVKKYIHSVRYSKTEIAVTLYYRASSEENFAQQKSAICPHPNSAFLPLNSPEKKEPANFLASSYLESGSQMSGGCLYLSAILPNIFRREKENCPNGVKRPMARIPRSPSASHGEAGEPTLDGGSKGDRRPPLAK